MKAPHDLIVFAKVISTSLLVIGYIMAGYYISIRLTRKGFPEWLEIALPTAGAIIGFQQGYWMIREIIKTQNKNKNQDKKK